MGPKWTHRYEREPGSGKWVFVPSSAAKAHGRQIKALIESRWRPPRYYFHLRRGGHVQAVRSHQNHKFFLRLDIKDFFGSVSKNRVTRVLAARIGYTEARGIADESTVRHPTTGKFILPYGFVQSPVLASLALHQSRLGKTLETISKAPGVKVSVYMDDIIVSCDDVGELNTFRVTLENAAAKSLLQLNPDKAQGPADEIEAFNLIVRENAVAVSEERLAEFLERYSSVDISEEGKVGIRAYVTSVNASQAAKFDAD